MSPSQTLQPPRCLLLPGEGASLPQVSVFHTPHTPTSTPL